MYYFNHKNYKMIYLLKKQQKENIFDVVSEKEITPGGTFSKTHKGADIIITLKHWRMAGIELQKLQPRTDSKKNYKY